MTNVVQLHKTFGATPEEWQHFCFVVGESDLLPVVSRPGAVISPQSTLKGLGKTPSTYNRQRQAIGIPKWTQKVSTLAEINRWMEDSDHGICVQTRRVRALDIDVPDPDLADQIEARFLEALGVGAALPARTRAGTGKRLLAFEVVGQLPKRSFRVEGGLVEFLGNGQQFVAVGEHFNAAGPSGTRYEWADGLPMAVPRITQAAFERAWLAVVEAFALEPAVGGEDAQDRSRRDLDGVADPVADYLEDEGLVLGAQGEKLFVSCPWKEGHTSDSGISETCWLVAGTRGFEQGHFQCMHASCGKRSDVDFQDAIGFRVAAFSDLDAEDGDAEPPGLQASHAGSDKVAPPWPKFKRDGKGKIEATLQNVELALARPDICELTVRYDTFRDDLMVEGAAGLRSFLDADAVRMRKALEQRGFKPVGRELMRDALLVHAADNAFDSAQDWLTSLPAWDGVERVETSLPRLFRTADTAYTRAVGLYIWTALAARVMDPGCKVDMVPIFQGEQGQRKSWAIAALTPDHLDAFREISLHALDANLSRKLRGCIAGELAELRGLSTRDAESIKAWIVQREERWTAKWQERETSFQRRCVLFGTTNLHEVLDDPTGERRWLPMEVLEQIDIDALVAERDQLWAEGLLLWAVDGVAWAGAERLARSEHQQFKVRDAWEGIIQDWLDQPLEVGGESPNERGWVFSADVARWGLGLDVRALNAQTTKRVGAVLRALGWRAQGHRVDGRSIWCWVRAV